MALVTASQVKALLDTALAGQDVRVFDYVNLPNRKKWDSVEIANTQPRSESADERVKEIKQTFIVTYLQRLRGAGSNEITRQKTIEDLIIGALDATALGQSVLFVENREAKRPQEVPQKPVPHYESTITVLITDKTSTTGEGTLAAQMTLTIDGLVDMPLLDKPAEKDNTRYEDIFDAKRNRRTVAPIGDSDTRYYVIEATETRRTTLKSYKSANVKKSCTLKRGSSQTENFNAKIADLAMGAPYGNIETIVIQVEKVD